MFDTQIKKISLILPTYCPDNEVKEALQVFKESLLKNTSRNNYELVIIEQGEKQDYTLFNPDRYIHFEKPIGYARAVNLGVALSSGDYLVVLNNDLELTKNWLENLVNDYEKEFKNEGLLSAMDYKREGIFENESWYSLFIISRKTWQTIGYFDEILGYRFHDQDYSIKLKKAGFKLGRTGNVLVGHKDATTFKKMNIDESNEKDIMVKRHGYTLFGDWFKNNNAS